MSLRNRYKRFFCHIGILLLLNLAIVTTLIEAAQKTPDDVVLLEITKQWRGMTTYAGKWLYFRLYKSGRAVYQDLKETGPGRISPVRGEVELTSSDQQHIMELIEASDFLSAREYYFKLEDTVDMIERMTVWTTNPKHKKQITVIEYNERHPKANSYYPASLIELLKLIYEIRVRNEE